MGKSMKSVHEPILQIVIGNFLHVKHDALHWGFGGR